MTKRLLLIGLIPMVAFGFVRVVTLPQLAAVEMNATVADSSSYYLYSYELVNPSASTWGLSNVTLDIGASSGTPDNLTTTGQLYDLTTTGGGGVDPHAEVGPGVPAGWYSILSRTATLTFGIPAGRFESDDSVAAGDTITGLVVRSTYLPGISRVYAEPTVESCCLVATDSTPDEFQYPTPGGFQVASYTLAPRFMPVEIDIGVLQDQLDAACSEPLWIDDAPLCAEIADSLEAVEDRLAINNVLGAQNAVYGVYSLLAANQEPWGDVDSNALVLAQRNGAQLLINMGTPGWPVVNLCVWSESAATAYFTVTATGDQLNVTSPHGIDGEVEGVDEPGSSCESVWELSFDMIELVDVSIRLDSVSAGSELDEFHHSGGLGSPVLGPDSIVNTLDGEVSALVIFLLKDSSLE